MISHPQRAIALIVGAAGATSWSLLVLAVPATTEVWSGWVGIAQKTGVRPGLSAAGHLALTPPGHRHHLAGGRRGVRAARLLRQSSPWPCPGLPPSMRRSAVSAQRSRRQVPACQTSPAAVPGPDPFIAPADGRLLLSFH